MSAAVRRSLAALVVGLLLTLPALARAEPPVWRIHEPDGGEVVLFGSIHLLTPGLAWRSPALDAALKGAGSLWFETPLDAEAAAAAQRTALAKSALPQGQSLAALLSRTGRERFARISAALGLAPGALDQDQPWFAELVLTLRQLQTFGADQGLGVEQTLMRAAPAAIPRGYFERPEEQVGFLADAPLQDQLASLEENLQEMEADPDSFEELERAWIGGDTAWIAREAILPLRAAAPGVYQRMVVERNRRWTARIEDLLKRKERAFIVVGVGHLLGPDSVPAMLRRRGIRVEGP